MKLLNEFKKFAMRGNVLDMAVGIIIGAAFGKIVDSLVKDVIMPPIGLAMGKIDFANLFFVLKDGTGATGPYHSLSAAQAAGAVTLNLGMFLNTIISFTIVAFAVFMLIKAVNTLQAKLEAAEKEGYDHFMIKEINEQATAVRNTLTQRENIQNIIDDIGDLQRICFVACGTSYHASLTGKYLIESLAGIPTDVILASEFKYSANTLNDKTLVVFISQSGETADSLKALDVANQTSKTLGIVNVAGSAITRRADYVIQTQAGPEIGVAATKTYVAQLTSIYLFAALLAKNVELLKELDKVPTLSMKP